MYRTVYKDKNPQQVKWPDDFEKAEYRQVFLTTPQPPPIEGAYAVKVTHGWWDEVAGESKHSIPLIKGSYETWAEAESEFRDQLGHCIGLGFVHSFHFDPLVMDVVYEDLTRGIPGELV